MADKPTKKQLLLNQCAENFAVADREFRRYRKSGGMFGDEWRRLQSIRSTFEDKLISAAKAFAPRISSPAATVTNPTTELDAARKE